MNELQELKFGALVRSRNTHLYGHYIRISHSRHCGPAYQVMDVYPPAVHSLGSTTIIFPNDCEIIRTEPTTEDIAATNAGLAAYAARQCSIKVGDVVVYHRWDKTKEGQVFKVEILCTVTKVMPVFNSHIRNSFHVTATCPPESEMEALEADESFFTRIEERLAQCS
jgi:hypothetical protein